MYFLLFPLFFHSSNGHVDYRSLPRQQQELPGSLAGGLTLQTRRPGLPQRRCFACLGRGSWPPTPAAVARRQRGRGLGLPRPPSKQRRRNGRTSLIPARPVCGGGVAGFPGAVGGGRRAQLNKVMTLGQTRYCLALSLPVRHQKRTHITVPVLAGTASVAL